MLGNCKLTIVIPLYNSKKYFPACIESIYQQGIDEREFEVIVVDDGSTDGVDLLADKAAEEHSNMKVIHQANTGSPTIPRNKGIALATGTYLFFCDSDDAFLPEAFQKMIHHADQDDFDIGLFNTESDGRDTYYGGLFQREMKNCTVFNSKIVNFLGPYKLFRTSFLRENQLKFPDTYYEDLSFTLEAYLLSKNTCVYNDGPYYYRRNRVDNSSMTQSGTTKRGANSLERRIRGLEYLSQTVSKYYSSSECPQIYKRLFERSCLLLKSCFHSDSPQDSITRIRKILKEAYSSDIIEILNLRCIMTVSALLNDFISFDSLEQLVFSWPDGPWSNLYESDGFLIFEQKDSLDRLVDSGSIKLTDRWIRSSNSRFTIIYNGDISLWFVEDAVCISGNTTLYSSEFESIDFVQIGMTGGGDESCDFPVSLDTFDFEIICPKIQLRRFCFSWHASIDLHKLPEPQEEHCRYAPSLVIHAGNQLVASRIGHTATDEMRMRFLRDEMRRKDLFYFGSFTRFGNVNIDCVRCESPFLPRIISSEVSASGFMQFRIHLCQAEQMSHGHVAEVAFVNRRSNAIVSIRSLAHKDLQSALEVLVAIDEQVFDDLLPKSEPDDIWDLRAIFRNGSEIVCEASIGRYRPAGTMALIREHASLYHGYAFILHQNAGKNFSLIIQREAKIHEEAQNLKITSICSEENRLVMTGRLDSKSVAMHPQISLAFFRESEVFEASGEYYDDLESRFRAEIRSVFELDDLLGRYDGKSNEPIDDIWKLNVVTAACGSISNHGIGTRRPKGSFEHYQKAACTNGIVALLPFQDKDKRLYLRVTSLSQLLHHEMAAENVKAVTGLSAIQVQGKLVCPAALCPCILTAAIKDNAQAYSLPVEVERIGGSRPSLQFCLSMPMGLLEDISKKIELSGCSMQLCLSLSIGNQIFDIPFNGNVAEALEVQLNHALSSEGLLLKVTSRAGNIFLRQAGIMRRLTRRFF